MTPYMVARPFVRVVIVLLVLAGLGMITSNIDVWPIVHSQTLTGNPIPLLIVTLKLTGAMIYLMCAWQLLLTTNNQ